MRVRSAIACLSLALVGAVKAQDSNPPGTGQLPAHQEQAPILSPESAEKFEYQSDIARLMRVVVSHLYNDRDVFVRELLSNSQDALEKMRLLSLTNPAALEGADQLNVTVVADAEHNRIVIRDSGVGMSKAGLAANLGTIARSGTSEFLEKLEKGDGGNLIGQFGLGFYSSFLVADRVTVASKSNDDPVQHIFESEADAAGFSIAPDPRGNTLGRGTEITLWIKEDAKEYLDSERLKALLRRHAEYNASPIYLWGISTTEEPIDDPELSDPIDPEGDVPSETPKTQTVVHHGWELVNDRAPLWMRDPKEVTDAEYTEFYEKTFKDEREPPLAWTHFKGDAGSTAFRALVYLPSQMPNDFYSKDYVSLESLKLFVRRVFITDNLGENYLPKHFNWIKVFVDADDLPLNVGRDSLQRSRALISIKSNLVKRTIELFANVAKNDPEKFLKLYSKAGVALKLGAIEDTKNRDKLVRLLRFETSSSEELLSLDEIVSQRKKGQTQLFYMAGIGQTKSVLEKSPFVERLVARGYTVIYMGEPMDEMLVSQIKSWGGLTFQDVAKKGLKFGDEDDDADAKEEEAELKATFEPLSAYLKKELTEFVENVVVSTRLTTSPCLVVASEMGWSANMERLMAAQNTGGEDNFMMQWAKSQKKTFEINPKHPLIESLLDKVAVIDQDSDSADEIRETVQVLWQTALVKSGFTVPDPNLYFSQIETILRRSLGVSSSAKAKVEVKPAPPTDDSPIESPAGADGAFGSGAQPDAEWADWAQMKEQLQAKENVAEGAMRDEL